MSEHIDVGAARSRAFQDLLRALVAGPVPPALLESSRSFMDDARAEDVVDLVDAFLGEGRDPEELKAPVSKLLNLLHRPLSARAPGLSADPLGGLLRAENAAMVAALDRARPLVAALNAAVGDTALGASAGGAEALAKELAEAIRAAGPVELHYQRLENVVFPFFEARYPRYRCLSLMWSIHDDVRRLLKDIPAAAERLAADGAADPEARAAVGAGSPLKLRIASLNARVGALFFAVHTLVFREEKILLPVALPLLSPEERRSLAEECLKLGEGFLDAEAVGAAKETDRDATRSRVPGAPSSPTADEAGAAISLNAGALPVGVIDALLTSLPVDMTFVDAENRVAWFSNGPHRVFPRSPAIIGREVRNCHPAASVGRVMAIIEAFRRGEREREAFWIQRGGRFVHIEYRALRDPSGAYLGTLEISEDITEKRALEGEKRLSAF